MAEIIDSHHHFWRYDPMEYEWIDDSMSSIRRDFLPGHLRAAIDGLGVDGVISVQARQTLEESRWLLQLAAQDPLIRAIVGWVPLTEPEVTKHLQDFSADPKFKGVRHIVQAELDDQYILRRDFNAGIRELRSFGLVYEILVEERHLPQTIEFVDRHPSQIFVLDHLALPLVKQRVLSPWKDNLFRLAERENVYSKLSGLATQADFLNWTQQDLQPYVECALEAFGPRRLMYGSDWPVCLIACAYRRWFETVHQFLAALSSTECDRIMGETAITVYGLARQPERAMG